MAFEVELTSTAAMEVEEDLEWLSQRNQEAAKRCLEGLLAAFKSLEQFPERCAIAPENEAFAEEIRLLVHEFSKQRKYRILFTVSGQTVYILHVRHGARKLIGVSDLPSDNPKLQ